MDSATQKVMFSSASEEWTTPQDFFDKLNAEFHFVLDAAATAENTKCNSYFSKEDNGLEENWVCFLQNNSHSLKDDAVWCNPPYGRGVTGKWIAKVAFEASKGVTTVMLLPARTDTKAWHQYIHGKPGVEVRFVKGRLKFGGCENSAPFPSAIVVFHGR